MTRDQPLESGVEIPLLARPEIEFTLAGPRSPKVKTKRGDVRVFKAFGRTEHYFVVHGAAVSRKWMSDDGDSGGILDVSIKRLETSGITADFGFTERLGIHSNWPVA